MFVHFCNTVQHISDLLRLNLFIPMYKTNETTKLILFCCITGECLYLKENQFTCLFNLNVWTVICVIINAINLNMIVVICLNIYKKQLINITLLCITNRLFTVVLIYSVNT